MEDKLSIFSSALLFEKLPAGKGKDKSTIECVERFCDNLYLGLKDGCVQYLSVKDGGGGPKKPREVVRRQMGRAGSGPVSQLKSVPVLNLLLVLWEGSLSTLNMFSLEPVQNFKKIQNVSVFCVGRPESGSGPVSVSLFVAWARRREVSVYRVCVDRWECVGRVVLAQEPLALAACETRLCVATSSRYSLHDYVTHSTIDLFPHQHRKNNVLVRESSQGEFLLNGPGNLGMFVMVDGISKRPPVQWPDGVVDAVVKFPFVLVLQSQAQSAGPAAQTDPHSRKCQSSSLHHSVFIVAERAIHSLTQTPLEDQIHSLLTHERVEEALTLLEGVQDLLPEDSYKELSRRVICTSGWIKFYTEAFSDAKELFIEAGLDPREVISLYPEMSITSVDYKPQCPAVSNTRDLWTLSRDDWTSYQHFLNFLLHFLRDTRGTVQGQVCPQEVDTALLKLYLNLEDYENLDQLVSSPNDCVLHVCVPELEHHKRYFTLGLLYQSQGQHFNAIQTWVRVVDGVYLDSRPDVFLHIIHTLTQIRHKHIIIKYTDWILQRDQQVGVTIFTKRDPEDQILFTPEEVLTILTNYPDALTLYLEYLVHELHSEEEKHHTLLVTTYITHVLQTSAQADSHINTEKIREKLQNLLWQSSIYNTETVHAQIKSSALHVEKAILLGRAGQHRAALQVLVRQERDQQAAERYCRRTSAGQSLEHSQQMFLCLLQVQLQSSQNITNVLDLLNNNPATFNLTSILQVLPGRWSLQLLGRFLCESLRGTVHQRRMRGLEKNLSKVENLRHRQAWMEATQDQIRLDTSCVCQICGRRLSEPEFIRQPTGDLIHTHCYTADQDQ